MIRRSLLALAGRVFLRRATLVACVFVAFAGGAMAQQQVSVRAVEHPEYSRLVLPVVEGTSWFVSSDRSRATLTLTGPILRYDLASVFDRMPRTRILSVRHTVGEEDTKLTLDLACACSVAVQRLGVDAIAVDVKRDMSAAISGPMGNPDGTEQPSSPPTAADLAAAPERLASSAQAVDVPIETGSAAPVQVGAMNAPTSLAERDALDASRSSLLGQLDNAAAEGLVTLAPVNDTILPRPERAPTSRLVDQIMPGDPDIAPDPAMSRGSLAAHLSLRGAAERQTPEPVPGRTVPDCRFEDALAPDLWTAADVDFSQRLGEMRRNLVTQAGEIDKSVVEELARFYISFGFGREASQLIADHGAGIEVASILDDISRTIEMRPVLPEGGLQKTMGCTGRLALWHAASGVGPMDFDPGSDTGMRGFLLELPPQLRRLTAVALSEQAIAQGEPESARVLIELLDRTPGDQSVDEKLTRARLFLEEGKATSAFRLTDRVLTGATVPSADVVLLQARAAVEGGGRISDRLMSSLEINEHIFSGSDLGQEIQLVRLQVLAADGKAGQALEEIRAMGSKAEFVSLGQSILADVVASEDPTIEKTRLILENRSLIPATGQGDRIRQQAAGHLIAQGLPNAALAVLEQVETVPNRDDRILTASANLQSGSVGEALAELRGLGDSEAVSLKVDALIRSGDVKAARDLAAQYTAETGDIASRLNILLGDWATNPEMEKGTGAIPSDTRETLAYAAIELERSRRTRGQFDTAEEVLVAQGQQ